MCIRDRLYGLEPTRIELISSAVNDTYRVDVPGEELFLRVYSPNAYYGSTADDFEFELKFTAHLAKNGVPTPSPIPTRTGQLLASFDASGNAQRADLFPKAAGAPHRAWWPAIKSDDAVRELGSLIARLHLAAESFSCNHSRYEFDLEFLLFKPLELLRVQMDAHGRAGDYKDILSVSNAAKEVVATLGKAPDVYGVIHGDAHVGNVYYDDELGFSLIDFDHCAHGWRVYDLVPLFITLELNVPDKQIAKRVRILVLEGYESVRPLAQTEHECIPAFQFLWHLWDVGENLVLSSTWGGPIKDEDQTQASFLDNAVQTIQRTAHYVAR